MFRSVLLALSLLILAAVACGGEGDLFFEPVQFTPEPTVPIVMEVAVEEIAVDGFLMAETNYLFHYRSLASSLLSLNRSLEGAASPGGSGSYDLAWVVKVHDLITRSEEIYRLILSLEADDVVRDKYAVLYLDTLRAIDVMVVGGDRLLSAAILLGPTGRSYRDMSQQDRWLFDGLVAESVHWLRSSGTLATNVSGSVNGHISRLASP